MHFIYSSFLPNNFIFSVIYISIVRASSVCTYIFFWENIKFGFFFFCLITVVMRLKNRLVRRWFTGSVQKYTWFITCERRTLSRLGTLYWYYNVPCALIMNNVKMVIESLTQNDSTFANIFSCKWMKMQRYTLQEIV